MNEGSVLAVSIDILLYIAILLVMRTVWIKDTYSTGKAKMGLFLFLLFCIFPFFGGDYFAYRSLFEIKKELLAGVRNTHIEPVYLTIMQYCFDSYEIFRLIVWGGAIYMMYLMASKLNIDRYKYLAFFSCAYITRFCYARVSLAMAIMFFGLSLFLFSSNNRNVLTKCFVKVLGIVILMSSYYFHKSALFGVGICILSCLFVKQNKFLIILGIILIPIFILLLDSMLLYIEDANISSNDGLINYSAAQSYMSSTSSHSRGIGGLISVILERIPYYLTAWLVIKSIFDDKYRTFPDSIRVFANASLFIPTVATLMLLISQVNTHTLYYRFMGFSIIPSAVYLTYLYKRGIYPKSVRFAFNIGIFYSIYFLVYILYQDLL
jgi:hypothetical protein